MSTVVVGTLKSNSTSPPAFQNTSGTEIGRLCRAFVNFDGATGTIRASFNVSSVTRNSAGNYTVNFLAAMPDANYCFTLSKDRATSDVSGYNSVLTAVTVAAGSLSMIVNYSNSVNGDTAHCCVAIFR